MSRGFRDKDFIESVDNLIFCVIGNVHPQSEVISYLKYVASYESGIRVKWSREGKMYGRVLPHYSALGFKEVINYLKQYFPSYVRFDEYFNTELILVPKQKIKVHFKPEDRLREILSNPRDELESLAAELIDIISTESGVETRFLGISGSILLKMHDVRFSDIDLVVYGRANALKIKHALIELLDGELKGFSRPKGRILELWAKDIVRIHPLSLTEAIRHYGKERWSRALFKGRQFSVRAVKLESEVDETYGSRVYRPKGLITIKCKVKDASDSMFLPCKYVVWECKVIEGPKIEVREVVSYEGLYSDIASEGEEILVRGKLEEVLDLKTNETYYRVCVGSIDAEGKDFIKPARWLK